MGVRTGRVELWIRLKGEPTGFAQDSMWGLRVASKSVCLTGLGADHLDRWQGRQCRGIGQEVGHLPCTQQVQMCAGRSDVGPAFRGVLEAKPRAPKGPLSRGRGRKSGLETQRSRRQACRRGPEASCRQVWGGGAGRTQAPGTERPLNTRRAHEGYIRTQRSALPGAGQP